jgi:hypothetical protein
MASNDGGNMMTKSGSFRQWMAVVLCACLVACGGGGGGGGDGAGSGSGGSGSGGGGSGGSGGGGSGGGGSGGSGSAGGAAITASLATGSYLEFLATSSSTSSTSAGTTSSNDYGTFRIALGSLDHELHRRPEREARNVGAAGHLTEHDHLLFAEPHGGDPVRLERLTRRIRRWRRVPIFGERPQ